MDPRPVQSDSTNSSPRRPLSSRHSYSSSLPSRSSTWGPHQHAPATPSQLRDSFVPSSSPSGSTSAQPEDTEADPASPTRPSFAPEEDRSWHPPAEHQTGDATGVTEASITRTEHRREFSPEPHARTRLLSHDWDRASGCGTDNCNHGTFSPRPGSHRSYGSTFSSELRDGLGGRFSGGLGEVISGSREGLESAFRTISTERLFGSSGSAGGGGSKTDVGRAGLALREYDSRHARLRKIAYYVPLLTWVPQYRLHYLKGDLVAALTMASFYIPMSLSYASNLGHIPPINGLYSFVFNPLVYAVLGTCPQMVVGPEAAGSLLTGEVVRENIRKGHSGDKNGDLNAQIAGAVTSTAGAIILASGLCRLGFLDSVLSRPFLRGFISAVGFVIFIDQLIPELGLAHVGSIAHGSSVDKLIYLAQNIRHAHPLTAAVSFGSFAIIMVCREIKKRLQPRFPSVAYVPDRFIVVVLSAVFAWSFAWDKMGLEVLGHVRTGHNLFEIHSPFDVSHLKHVSEAFSTSFVIALLGFFESSVAAKSLGIGEGKNSNGIKDITLSANRELVALGTANVIGGLFMALPAFGGYGRSKVNASTGGKTPMSSIFLSLITLFCVLFLLPYFYYLPKGVLSAMISVVAYSLLEEAPHDVAFFWRIGGTSELILMLLIFLTTIFWNLKIGIAAGTGLSLLRVLRHSTRPRIQILGRVPGTTDRFENAETHYRGLTDGVDHDLEFFEGCLIVKIPEPLTFANTGELKSRLRRLEVHGTTSTLPSSRLSTPAPPPQQQSSGRSRRASGPSHRNIIFDVHGVTSMDGAGAQVLAEIVAAYRARGVRVFFSRVPSRRSEVWRLFDRSGIVEMCGGESHFVSEVQEALRLTEREESVL